MSKAILISICQFVLVGTAFLSAQETQTSTPASPSPSIYNRMRSFPAPGQGGETGTEQPRVQTQQFPSAQFPPEQQGPLGQRPAMSFPQAGTTPERPGSTQMPDQGQASHAQSPVPSVPQTAYGLALQPANPPKISYTGGQLTVHADNSSLAEVLKNIGKVTGARVDGNLPADNERVFGQFGPGTVREIINSLLSGSRYDYILVGAVDEPGNVQQIMLTPHGGSLDGADRSLNTAANRPPASTSSDDDESADTNVAPQQVEAPPPPAQSIEQPQPGQQQVKTPEQLLQELQRLRQQQQQQQGQPQPH